MAPRTLVRLWFSVCMLLVHREREITKKRGYCVFFHHHVTTTTGNFIAHIESCCSYQQEWESKLWVAIAQRHTGSFAKREPAGNILGVSRNSVRDSWWLNIYIYTRSTWFLQFQRNCIRDKGPSSTCFLKCTSTFEQNMVIFPKWPSELGSLESQGTYAHLMFHVLADDSPQIYDSRWCSIGKHSKSQ
jgi:hypothetical protein